MSSEIGLGAEGVASVAHGVSAAAQSEGVAAEEYAPGSSKASSNDDKVYPGPSVRNLILISFQSHFQPCFKFLCTQLNNFIESIGGEFPYSE